MAEIKALEKLRDRFGCIDGYYFTGDGSKRTTLMDVADAIQAEVDERFIELPVDADGVSVRVGDVVAEKPFRPKMGEKPSEVVCMLLNSDGWAIGDCDPYGHWYGPLQLEHVKPRTIEGVLREYRHDASIIYDDPKIGGEDRADALEWLDEKVAAEIRELAKEGIE